MLTGTQICNLTIMWMSAISSWFIWAYLSEYHSDKWWVGPTKLVIAVFNFVLVVETVSALGWSIF